MPKNLLSAPGFFLGNASLAWFFGARVGAAIGGGGGGMAGGGGATSPSKSSLGCKRALSSITIVGGSPAGGNGRMRIER